MFAYFTVRSFISRLLNQRLTTLGLLLLRAGVNDYRAGIACLTFKLNTAVRFASFSFQIVKFTMWWQCCLPWGQWCLPWGQCRRSDIKVILCHKMSHDTFDIQNPQSLRSVMRSEAWRRSTWCGRRTCTAVSSVHSTEWTQNVKVFISWYVWKRLSILPWAL